MDGIWYACMYIYVRSGSVNLQYVRTPGLATARPRIAILRESAQSTWLPGERDSCFVWGFVMVVVG